MSSAEHLIAKLERLSKRFSSSRAQPKVEVKSRIPKRRESVKPKRPSEKKIREYLDDKFTEFLEERKAKPQKQKRSTSIPSRRTAPTRVEKPVVPQAIKEAARQPVVPKTRGHVSATKTEQKKIHDVAPRQRLTEPVVSAAKPKIVAKKAPVRDQKWKCLQSSSSDEEIDRLLNTRKPEPAKKDTSAKALLAQLEISDSSSDDVILEEIRRRNAARKQETEALKRKSPAVKKSPTHEKKEVFKIGDRTYTLDSSSDSEVLPPKAPKANPVLLGARKINISSSSSDDEILLRALQKRTTARPASPKKVESSSSDAVKPTSPIRKSPKKPALSSSSSDELLAQITGKSQALSALKKVVISSSSSDEAVSGVVRKESPVKPLTRAISSSSSDDELLRRVLPKRSSPVRVSPKKPPVISSSSSDEIDVRRGPKAASPVRVSPKKHSVISSSSSDEIDVLRVPKAASPVRVSPRRTVISSSSSDEIVPRTVPKPASPIRVSPRKASVISSSSSDDLLLGAIGLQPVTRKSPSPVKVKPVNVSSDDEPILPTTKPSPKGYKIQRLMVESHISENSSSDNVRVIAPPKRVMTPKDKRNEVRAALADASSSSSSEEPNLPVKPGSPLSIGGAMAVSYVPDEGIAEEEKRALHSTPKAKQPVSVLDRSHELLASGSPNARKSEILRKYGISDSSDSEAQKPLEPVHSSSNSDDFRPNDEVELKKKLAEVGMALVSSSDSEKDTRVPQPSVKVSEEKPAKQSSASRRSEILKSLGLSVTSSDLESDSEDLDVEIKIGRPGKQEETSQSKKYQLAGISSSSEDDKINVSASLKKEEPQKESREDVLARMNEEHRISGSDEELFSLTQPSPRSSLTPSPMRSRDNTSDSGEQETGDKGNGLQVIDDITPKEILISSLSNSGELRAVVQSLNLQDEEEEEDVEPASGSEADPEKHVSDEESHDEVIIIDANQAVGGGSESSDHEENLPIGGDAIVLVDEKYVKAVPTIRMPTPRPSCQNLLQDEEEENAVASESDGTEEEAPKPAKPMRPIPRPTLSPKLPGLALKPLSKPKPKIPHPPSPGTQVQVPAKAESSSSSDNAGDVVEEEAAKEREFAIAPVAADEAKPDDLKAFLEQDVDSSGAEEEGDILGLQIKYDDSDSVDDMKHSDSDIENDPMATPKVISSHAVDGEVEKSEPVSTDSSSEEGGNEQAIVEETPMDVQQESSSDEDDLGVGTKVQSELLKENEGRVLSDDVIEDEVLAEEDVEGVHSEEEEEIHLEEDKEILHDEEEASLEQKEVIDEEEKEISHEQDIHFEEEAIDEEEEIHLQKEEVNEVDKDSLLDDDIHSEEEEIHLQKEKVHEVDKDSLLDDDIHSEEEEVSLQKEKEIPSDEDIHVDEVIGDEGVHSEEEEEIHLEQDKEIIEEASEEEENHVHDGVDEDEIRHHEPEEDTLDLHEEEQDLLPEEHHDEEETHLNNAEEESIHHENENLEEESDLDLSQPAAVPQSPDLPKSGLSDGDELDSDMDDDEILAKANSVLDRLGIAISSESDEEGTLEVAKRITDKRELHSNEEETTLEEVLPGHDGVDLDLSDEEDLDNSHFATKVHSALVEDDNATEDQVLFESGNASDIVSDEEESQRSAPEMDNPDGDVGEDELLRSDDE